MTTYEWLRQLSTIDSGTALMHFKSINVFPADLNLTIVSENIKLKEENKFKLEEFEDEVLKIDDNIVKLVKIEESKIKIIDEEKLNGI